ncbi:hypothetical protein HG531_010502 [Fusarium graminearum]|nr:hypothetical protein HG531_010502 [Fusarium graminearum]
MGSESRVGVLRHVDLLARRSLALEEILDFAAVIANVLLADVGNLLHLLRSNALDLGSLVVDELGSVVELLVDELLVGSVDQRHNKGNSGTNEDNSLSLNDEKVDELMNVANNGVQSLTGNCVVSSRANLSSQTIVENNLAKNLSENGHTKDHPGCLQTPSEDI